MTVGSERFRRALSRLAGGVAIVTSRGPGGEPRGLTATAVCSVSLSPPLVLACLDVGTNTHEAVASSGVYALHFLGEGHIGLARRFARRGGDKFSDLAVGTAETGAPILEGTLAWCDCTVDRTVRAGDHTIFIGGVRAIGLAPRAAAGGEGPGDAPGDAPGGEGHGEARGAEPAPLVYFRGRYRALGGQGAPRERGRRVPER